MTQVNVGQLDEDICKPELLGALQTLERDTWIIQTRALYVMANILLCVHEGHVRIPNNALFCGLNTQIKLNDTRQPPNVAIPHYCTVYLSAAMVIKNITKLRVWLVYKHD